MDRGARGKSMQRHQDGAWRGTTDETDLEEDEEERSVPVVSGENKRKRAPRGGGNVRRVKLKPLTHYEGTNDHGDASGSTQENERAENHEQGDATSAKEVEKRRESSRVRIKTIKARENAEATKFPKGKSSEKKDAQAVSSQKRADEEAKPEVSHRPVKLHLSFSDKPKSAPTPPNPSKGGSVKNAVAPTTTTSTESPPSNAPSVQKTQATSAEAHESVSPADQGELESALKVIKKLMKMDAAHPFNKPVDPVGQGVPDYLEIIDTPMDFGTICENLEKLQKYKTASDVYKDIQQIWVNCRTYNRKGDPILDLMKKVQKACSKYWTASGVFRDGKKSNKKGEVQAVEQPAEVLASSHLPSAGTTSHKANCTCVVCVNVRRRAAREKRAVGLGSARAVKRQIAKMKGKQDLNEAEMEELVQLEEAYDHMEEADHFFPASYQIPLRPVNPAVLSLGQALFSHKSHRVCSSTANPFLPLVSAYAGSRPN